MQKYKICPSCHQKNEPTLLECLYCEADLTRVKITDEETEKCWKKCRVLLLLHRQKQQWSEYAIAVKRIQQMQRKCRACNEDILRHNPNSRRITLKLKKKRHQFMF